VDVVVRCFAVPEFLACCAASGKQKEHNPSARMSAPLDMRELKTKSLQTPVKLSSKRTWLRVAHTATATNNDSAL